MLFKRVFLNVFKVLNCIYLLIYGFLFKIHFGIFNVVVDNFSLVANLLQSKARRTDKVSPLNLSMFIIL